MLSPGMPRKPVHNLGLCPDHAVVRLRVVLDEFDGIRGGYVVLHRKAFLPFILVALVVSHPAWAEDLAMPYACSVENGVVRLEPSTETSYLIHGRREEQTFARCPAGRRAPCEQVMLHRFMISCGGEKVAWSRVAAAARSTGISYASDLPAGFAPVVMLGGHFVLPALPHSTALITRVATQELSPDSVIDTSDREDPSGAPSWVTTVKDDVRVEPPGGFFRVAGAVTAVMIALFAASMVAAGRWRLPGAVRVSPAIGNEAFAAFLNAHISSCVALLREQAAKLRAAMLDVEHSDDGEGLANAVAAVRARIAETGLEIAALPDDLLLREVLQSELANTQRRLSALERDLRRSPAQKTAAVLRALMRDMDRIGRIVHSAHQAPGAEAAQGACDLPRSVGEAYRLLGLNANAPAEVAKRLVDALRMNWHPDHASDETDRQRREARIKQINAAWDIVNGRREAA